MATEQVQANGNQLKIDIRPITGLVKEAGTRIDHELCVIFPCGRKVVVNQNTKYALNHFQDDERVIGWACELLTYRNDCALLRMV